MGTKGLLASGPSQTRTTARALVRPAAACVPAPAAAQPVRMRADDETRPQDETPSSELSGVAEQPPRALNRVSISAE